MAKKSYKRRNCPKGTRKKCVRYVKKSTKKKAKKKMACSKKACPRKGSVLKVKVV